jgi:hypothetical protein
MNNLDPIIRRLVPRYNELALFLMSISFILVFFTYEELRAIIVKILFYHFFELELSLPPIIFVLGIVYCLYHVFTKRRKTDFEKFMMLLFAISVNAVSGIAAGMHILSHAFDALPGDASVIQLTPAIILILFPFWNIFNGVWLLFILRFQIIDESVITDENATPLQVLLGSMILLLVFLLCYTVFKLHWIITLSICVGCATSVSGIVQESLSGSQSN